MQLDELIKLVQENEQALGQALEEENFSQARVLGLQSQRLIQQFADLKLSPEQVEPFKEFAHAYIEHIKDMLSMLTNERDVTAKELLKFKKKRSGVNKYLEFGK